MEKRRNVQANGITEIFQVLRSLSLPSALPVGQKKLWKTLTPTIQDRLQYIVSFEAFLRRRKSTQKFLITNKI